MTYAPGQLVRVLHPHSSKGRVVLRLTPTLVVLTDGTRWSRKTGILYGVGPTATRIEPWYTRKGADGAAA
jgi:hypothetical protein